MSSPTRFLNALGQALSSMTLYADGHPARERALDAVYRELSDLQAATPCPLFTFLGEETIYGQQRLWELKGWDWGRRLAQAGIQRLEFEARVDREEFDGFLDEVLARLTLPGASTAEARQMRRSNIKFGAVGLKGEADAPREPLPTATLNFSLGEEVETLKWLQDEVRAGRGVPLLEAEAIVRSLSLAMHGGQRLILPMLHLKEFDQYTTTHSLNVAVLAMATAEFLGMGPREVQALGIGGLLHDIGKIKVPIEVLTKPGKLTPDERLLMNLHPVDGARMLLEAERNFDVAVVVAYEHHVMLDGGGYPRFRYPRECHPTSKLVHVCDVYDALRTNRPYREAWPSEKALAYVHERSTTEFDPGIAGPFGRMMQELEQQVAVLTEVSATLPAPAG